MVWVRKKIIEVNDIVRKFSMVIL